MAKFIPKLIRRLKMFYGTLCPYNRKCPRYKENYAKCCQPMGFDGFKLCDNNKTRKNTHFND